MKLSQIGTLDKIMQYHDSLYPGAWDNWEMKPEVRKSLLKIANLFKDSLEIPDLEVSDVVLSGSMANFNYTQHSDFDLHLVVDFDQFDCEDMADVLFRAKKTLWNNAHDITIMGHEVELYVEDADRPAVSAGYFSIKNNKWINKPEYLKPTFDRASVNKKVKTYIDYINKTIRHSRDPEDFAQLLTRLRRLRQNGLESGGEFSTENLAFKALRHLGYIDRLSQAQTKLVDQHSSL